MSWGKKKVQIWDRKIWNPLTVQNFLHPQLWKIKSWQRHRRLTELLHVSLPGHPPPPVRPLTLHTPPPLTFSLGAIQQLIYLFTYPLSVFISDFLNTKQGSDFKLSTQKYYKSWLFRFLTTLQEFLVQDVVFFFVCF